MFKLLSAIFTAGIAVGIFIAVRRRRPTTPEQRPTEIVDQPKGDGATAPSTPATVRSERLRS